MASSNPIPHQYQTVQNHTHFKSTEKTRLKPNDYLLISLRYNFNRNVFQKMKSFTNRKEILNPSQYSTRNCQLSIVNCIDIVNAIQTNMETRLYSCRVYKAYA